MSSKDEGETTAAVISQSANVVVQRMDAGYPTWNLTAAVGEAEEEAKDNSGIITQITTLTPDQIQQIAALQAAPVSKDHDTFHVDRIRDDPLEDYDSRQSMFTLTDLTADEPSEDSAELLQENTAQLLSETSEKIAEVIGYYNSEEQAEEIAVPIVKEKQAKESTPVSTSASESTSEKTRRSSRIAASHSDMESKKDDRKSDYDRRKSYDRRLSVKRDHADERDGGKRRKTGQEHDSNERRKGSNERRHSGERLGLDNSVNRSSLKDNLRDDHNYAVFEENADKDSVKDSEPSRRESSRRRSEASSSKESRRDSNDHRDAKKQSENKRSRRPDKPSGAPQVQKKVKEEKDIQDQSEGTSSSDRGRPKRNIKSDVLKRALKIEAGNIPSSEEEDEGGESDWTSDDDPDRLWCICKKPHDQRFMICCDKCEDWFHGTCVNVTKADGKRMEKKGELWYCPNCLEGKSTNEEMTPSPPEKGKGNHNKKDRKEDPKKDRKEDPKKDDGQGRRRGPATKKVEEKKETKKEVKREPKNEERKRDDHIEKRTSREGVAESSLLGMKSFKKESTIKKEEGKDSETSVKKFYKGGTKMASPESVSRKKRDSLAYARPPVPSQPCIMTNCGSTARNNQIYCSNRCILRHAVESLQILHQEKWFSQGFKKDIKDKDHAHCEGDRVPVVERHTNRLRTGLSAPTPEDLPQWLERHPSYEVLRPTKTASITSLIAAGKVKQEERDSKKRRESSSHHPTEKHSAAKPSPAKEPKESKEHHEHKEHKESTKETTVKKESKKEPEESSRRRKSSEGGEGGGMPKKIDKAAQAAQASSDLVRQNVKKTLNEVLNKRLKDATELKKTPEDIKKLADTIESQLFKLHKDTGMKYKAKYRTLIFNLKDVKNKGLFRRVVQQKIRPEKLVQMSSEQLASKELAEWREREAKHTLDMIVQIEEDWKEVPIIKKTHKGEIDINEEKDMSSLSNTFLDDSNTSPSDITSPTTSNNKGLSSDPFSPSALKDTTDLHRSHLFDLNCRICTGKEVPSEATPSSNPKTKISRQVSKVEDKHVKEEEEEEQKLQEIPTKVEQKRQKKKKLKISEQDKGSGIRQKSSKTLQKTSTILSKTGSKKGTSGGGDGKVEEKKKAPVKPSSNSVQKDTSSYVASTPPGSPPSAEMSPIDDKDNVPETPPQAKMKSFWKGFVFMQDVSKFMAASYHVSGPFHVLKATLPDTLEVHGRIPFSTVWDYFRKLRTSGSTEMLVLRFHVAHDEDKGLFADLFHYFNNRQRIGVVGKLPPQIKDFYLLPLPSHGEIPPELLPFNGPGLSTPRPHMLLGLLTLHKEKARPENPISPTQVQPRQVKATQEKAEKSGQKRPSAGSSSKVSKMAVKFALSEASETYQPPLVKRIKKGAREVNTGEQSSSDPIVAQYGSADQKDMSEDAFEPYSPTREEQEAPYDPTDVMDDIPQKEPAKKKVVPEDEEEAYSPSMAMEDSSSSQETSRTDVEKLNELLKNVSSGIPGNLKASDIASAASDATENLLSSLGEANLSDQQQLLVQLTRQVEEAKKALLDKQIESLQSEINKATSQMQNLAGTETQAGVGMGVAMAGFEDDAARGVLKVPADSSTSGMTPVVDEHSSYPAVDYGSYDPTSEPYDPSQPTETLQAQYPGGLYPPGTEPPGVLPVQVPVPNPQAYSPWQRDVYAGQSSGTVMPQDPRMIRDGTGQEDWGRNRDPRQEWNSWSGDKRFENR